MKSKNVSTHQKENCLSFILDTEFFKKGQLQTLKTWAARFAVVACACVLVTLSS